MKRTTEQKANAMLLCACIGIVGMAVLSVIYGILLNTL